MNLTQHLLILARSVRTPVRQKQHLTADAGFVKTNLQQHNGGDGLTKADS